MTWSALPTEPTSGSPRISDPACAPLDFNNFGSRVAQRVFVLFLACALVPTGVVGVFAWRRTSSELERAAREQLRRDSKGEGMAIVSRLLVADGLLRALGEGSTQVLAAAPRGASSDPMPWRAVRRTRPEDLPGGPLVASERQAIEAGKSVLRVPGEQHVLLVHAPDPARAGRLIAADLDPAYLWTYDRNDPDSGSRSSTRKAGWSSPRWRPRRRSAWPRRPSRACAGKTRLRPGRGPARRALAALPGQPFRGALLVRDPKPVARARPSLRSPSSAPSSAGRCCSRSWW